MGRVLLCCVELVRVMVVRVMVGVGLVGGRDVGGRNVGGRDVGGRGGGREDCVERGERVYDGGDATIVPDTRRVALEVDGEEFLSRLFGSLAGQVAEPLEVHPMVAVKELADKDVDGNLAKPAVDVERVGTSCVAHPLWGLWIWSLGSAAGSKGKVDQKRTQVRHTPDRAPLGARPGLEQSDQPRVDLRDGEALVVAAIPSIGLSIVSIPENRLELGLVRLARVLFHRLREQDAAELAEGRRALFARFLPRARPDPTLSLLHLSFGGEQCLVRDCVDHALSRKLERHDLFLRWGACSIPS